MVRTECGGRKRVPTGVWADMPDGHQGGDSREELDSVLSDQVIHCGYPYTVYEDSQWISVWRGTQASPWPRAASSTPRVNLRTSQA